MSVIIDVAETALYKFGQEKGHEVYEVRSELLYKQGRIAESTYDFTKCSEV